MPRPKLRPLVAYAFLLTIACDPRSRSARGSSPDVELSAASPKAALTVTLCMDGPEIHHLSPSVHASVVARVTASDPTKPTTGLWIDLPGKRQRFDLMFDTKKRIPIELDSSGPWTGHAGPRCSDPQVIHVELDEADPSAKLTIQLNAMFEVVETSIFFAGDGILSSNATLRIDATPPS